MAVVAGQACWLPRSICRAAAGCHHSAVAPATTAAPRLPRCRRPYFAATAAVLSVSHTATVPCAHTASSLKTCLRPDGGMPTHKERERIHCVVLSVSCTATVPCARHHEDLGEMYRGARLWRRLWLPGRRRRPREEWCQYPMCCHPECWLKGFSRAPLRCRQPQEGRLGAECC